MSRKPCNEVNGVLLVDKTGDWTSHDVVNCVKHRFNLSKAGHCGTLDPLATGLLVILLGKATKLQDQLMSDTKVYDGSLRLGLETDSEDITGEVTCQRDVSAITEERLLGAMGQLTGAIKQVPPMYSAIKKNGRPLYELARKGIEIEREAREVTIYSFELLRAALPDADFRVVCSKGTYVRTLCADIGKILGCGGIMTALRRVQCGEFKVGDAFTMDTIKTWELEELQEHVFMPSL